MGHVDRRGLSTAQRLAEYIAELRARGIQVIGATVEGRKIRLDFDSANGEAVNPADLVDP